MSGNGTTVEELQTRLKRYERLLEVTRILGEQTDLDGLLEAIVSHTTTIVDVERTSLFFYDPAREVLWSKVAQGLNTNRITLPVTQGLVGAAAISRQIVRVDDVYNDGRFDQSIDVNTGFRTQSILCVPVLGEDEGLLGVLQAINARSGHFGSEDEQLLQALASQISVAMVRSNLIERKLENKRLHEALKMAQEVQLSLLPALDKSPIDTGVFRLDATMIPAQMVGGDFYDAFEIGDGRLALVIGDVSGKGMPAAVLMARALTLIRGYARIEPMPSRAMELVNAELAANNDQGMFVTAFLAYLDTASGEMSFANAGHNAPYLWHADGSVSELPGTGNLPLAAWEESEYETLQAQLDAALCLYTDGVTEAVNPGMEEYGEQRLIDLLREMTPAESAPCAAVVRQVEEFARGEPQADDITLLVACRTQ